MNTQLKTRPEDTRARIIETADALFRRIGFAKTAVADIASELRMSPANVYRFFSSKAAIVDAICKRCLSDLEEKAWAVARSRASASVRLEKLVLTILAYHKENLITEQRVNDIVLVAMEHSWDAIIAHEDSIRSIMELIVRDGVSTGEFEPVDPAETATLLKQAIIRYCHPVLVADCLKNHDLEAEARASVRFLLRAITPRR
jgi:AcrR family transcriptional regulator